MLRQLGTKRGDDLRIQSGTPPIFYGSMWGRSGTDLGDNQGIWRHLEPFVAICKLLEPFGSIWSRLESFGTSWSYFDQFGAI